MGLLKDFMGLIRPSSRETNGISKAPIIRPAIFAEGTLRGG